MSAQYVSMIISIAGFLITVATLGYGFGRFQANTDHMKERIAENKFDYKEIIAKHEASQKETILRLYAKIEALESKEIISKDDCRSRTSLYDNRLHEVSQTFCGHIEKMSNKLNLLEVSIVKLIEKSNKDR